AQPVRTRAILLTDQRRHGQSVVAPVRLFAPRLANLAPLAGARANAEYQAPDNFGGAAYRAISVVRGQGTWENTGKDDKGMIAAPPVSDLHPAWLVLAWDSPQELVGLYLQDNFGTVAFEVF